MVRKEIVIDSWKTARLDTAQAVEDFPAAELDFKATPDLMTFGELARHILDAGHALSGMLLDGVDNLATPQFREMIGRYRPQLPERLDAPTLASELRKSIETCGADLKVVSLSPLELESEDDAEDDEDEDSFTDEDDDEEEDEEEEDWK